MDVLTPVELVGYLASALIVLSLLMASLLKLRIINLVVTLRDRARQGYFEVVGVPTSSPILRRFVDFHRDDMRRFQPSFEDVDDDHLAWMVLRDAVPVGAVLGRRDGDRLLLDLDDVTPEHRDFTAGAVLFGDSGAFHDAGVTTVSSLAETEAHRRYLDRMGFEPEGEHWRRSVEGVEGAGGHHAPPGSRA